MGSQFWNAQSKIEASRTIKRFSPEGCFCLSPFYQEGVGGVAGGPFATSLNRFQDWDLWLSMLERGQTGIFIPEVLYEKTVGSREGISTWLPSFVYQLPWKSKEVKKYESAKQIILKKHHL